MKQRLQLTICSMALLAWADVAFAQSSGELEDIVVTARKRDETSIAVPVALSAVGGAELERRAINSMDGLGRIVPALTIGDNASITGGIVAIRGLAGADTNGFGDQAVSFNIDGAGIGRATVRRMAEMDVQQIEVLKGPQALFFGKNSPAGIISIRTADPTDKYEAKVSTGYEVYADETRTEGYLSGPITKTLGIRIAGYFSHMDGWGKSVVPADALFQPASRRFPKQTDVAGRLTLKWEPTDRFTARFKLSYGNTKNDGPTSLYQLVDCPLGRPQGITRNQNCVLDNTSTTASLGPVFGTLYSAFFGNGRTYFDQSQLLSSLELNYDLTDKLKLTSMTSLYQQKNQMLGNFTLGFEDTPTLPVQLLPSWQALELKEITQEVRVTSNFDGRFNFMAGGLYQDTTSQAHLVAARNSFAPTFVNDFDYLQKAHAYSFFGQGMIDILQTLEFSFGARYSHENKELDHALSAVPNDPLCPGINKTACSSRLFDVTGPNFPHQRSFNNLSPEATLSWRPNQDLTVYGSYKQGFLSGGFSAANPVGFVSPTFTTSSFSSYNQQTTKGFEVGVKSLLLNGTLRANLALYTYKTEGLQVTVTTAGTQVELRNAGAVRTKGAEFDLTYKTPITGLNVTSGVAYNKGTYLDYQASCYRGESSALCFPQPNRSNNGVVATLQDLSGTPLVRAPEWTGNAGFNFERPITSGLKIGLSANMSFSTGFFTQVTSSPGSWQKSYQLYDATLRFGDVNDRWEFAVIGRNLSNEYYFVRSSDSPFTGTTPGAAPVGILGDTGAIPSRGREVMLRASMKFGG